MMKSQHTQDSERAALADGNLPSVLRILDDDAEKACKPSEGVSNLLAGVERDGNPINDLTPESAVELWMKREIGAMDVIKPIQVDAKDVFIPARNHQIPIRIYTPPEKTNPLPVVVFVHGGGACISSIGTYDSVTRYLALKTPALVASVDYRLAPECPFPAGFHDVYLALHWVKWHSAEHGGEPARVAIVGDSGGANLAVAVTVAARNAGLPIPQYMALFYPSTDFTRTDRHSHELFGRNHLLTTKSVEAFRSFYAPNRADWSNPLISPLLTPKSQLQQLPPTLLIMAGCDPLRDEGRAFAEKIRDAMPEANRKDSVTSLVAPEMVHGFLLFFNKRPYESPHYRSVLEDVKTILDYTAKALNANLQAGG